MLKSLTFLGLVLSLQTINCFGQLTVHNWDTNQINYYLYSPKDTSSSPPLVVFLHGGGEGGDSIQMVLMHGYPKLIASGKDFPFYLLAPQNPYKNGFWDDRKVDKLIDHLVDSLNIEDRSIYLAGMSRGGYGVWRMAINNPDKYAGMLSICAASIPMIYVKKLQNMPIWIFHGEKDQVVPVEQSKLAYEVLKPINSNVKLTLYPEANHDSWTNTFNNPEVTQWLLSHQK